MTPPEDLLVLARAIHRDYHAMIQAPDWHGAGAVHDWRCAIPEAMQRLWDRLDYEARVAAFVIANNYATTPTVKTMSDAEPKQYGGTVPSVGGGYRPMPVETASATYGGEPSGHSGVETVPGRPGRPRVASLHWEWLRDQPAPDTFTQIENAFRLGQTVNGFGAANVFPMRVKKLVLEADDDLGMWRADADLREMPDA